MARWSTSRFGWTPVAVADTAAFTDGGYHALQGGSTTQVLEIQEITINGKGSSSAVNDLAGARSSTVGASSLSGALNAALNPATAALAAPPLAFSASTTKPQRSATLKPLTLGLNAFGGIAKFMANKGEGIGMLGNAASFGEFTISAESGGTPGAINSHMVYEPQ